MVTLGVHGLPKAVCESERQTAYLSISNCDAIIWQRMLINNQIVQRYRTGNPPADVAGSVWAYGVVAIPETTPEEQLVVR